MCTRKSGQRGLSLIELMVAIAIGSILMLGVGQVFMGGRISFQLSEGLSRMQETGRLAIQMLSHDLRVAGYSNHPEILRPEKSVIANGATGYFPFGDTSSGEDYANQTTAVPAGAAGDMLVIQRQSATDCLGQATPTLAVSGGGAINVAVNRYWVEGGQLRCLGNGNVAPQALMDGVEHMEVQYGLDTDNDVIADIYRNAANLTAAQWANVVSVRIALLVNSINEINSLPVDDQTYRLLDSVDIDPDPDDRRMRRVFTTTVLLRNRRPDPT